MPPIGAFPFARPAHAAHAQAKRPSLRRQLPFDPFGFSFGLRRDAGAVLSMDAGAVLAMDAGFLDTGFLDTGYVVSDAGFLVTDAGVLVSDAGAVLDVGFLMDDARGVSSELDLCDPDAGFLYDEAGSLMLMQHGPMADMEAAGFFDDVVTFFKKKVAPIAKSIEKAASPFLDTIQKAASAIPGYGTVIAGALGAARGLAQGKTLAQSAMQGFGSMIPGGAIGAGIAQGALGMIDNAFKSKSASKTAKSALAALPIGGKGRGAPNLTALAQGILASPALRSLPTAQLASALKTSPSIAHAAQQLVMGRMGAHAPAGKSIEQALALAGRPAPAAPRPQISAVPVPVHTSRFPGFSLAGLMPQRRDAAGIDPNMPSIYVVESGDTYVRIAAKLGHAGQHLDLYKANPQIGKDAYGNPAIHPGTRLNIPAAWQVAPTQLPADSAAQLPVPVAVPTGTYTVQPGDTLVKIAAQFGHPGEEMAIYAVNKPPSGPMAFGADTLYAGWVLTLPWGGQGQAPPPPPIPSPVPAPVPVPIPPPPDGGLTGIPPWLQTKDPGENPGPLPIPSPVPVPVPSPVPSPVPGPVPAPAPQQQQSSGGGLATVAVPLILLALLGK